MAQPVDVYAWRTAIMSEAGPGNPLARIVLMAISLHMKSDGTGAWPSQKLIAVRAAVGERSVRRHLDEAGRDGWIERTRARCSNLHAWYRTEYAACIPDEIYARLPERPWESDPTWTRQPAPVAATTHHTSAEHPVRVAGTSGVTVSNADNQGSKCRPTATEQPANGAQVPATQTEVPANGDTNNRPQLGLLTLPLNSSLSSPKNSSHEGALSRTAMADKQSKEVKTADSEIRRKILKLAATDYDVPDIVKLMNTHGTTTEQVIGILSEGAATS